MKETYNTPVVDIVFLNDVDVITYSKDNPASILPLMQVHR